MPQALLVFALGLLAVFSVNSKIVYAGNLVGNGGLVVKCETKLGRPQSSPNNTATNTTVQYILLDFLQTFGKDPYADSLVQSAGGNPEVLVRGLIRRLGRLDQTRASKYIYWHNKFQNEVRYIEESLPRTMDAGLVEELPAGCELIQAVVQRKENSINESRYVIDASIWNELDTITKAGLIVHELVLRDALEQDLSDTQGVRKFVRFLFSQDLQVAGPTAYKEVLKESPCFRVVVV